MMADMDANGLSHAAETAATAAYYIASLTDELAQMARRHHLDTLSYILEMARLEADQVAKGSTTWPGLFDRAGHERGLPGEITHLIIGAPL